MVQIASVTTSVYRTVAATARRRRSLGRETRSSQINTWSTNYESSYGYYIFSIHQQTQKNNAAPQLHVWHVGIPIGSFVGYTTLAVRSSYLHACEDYCDRRQ
jgi:hypothetical protein